MLGAPAPPDAKLAGRTRRPGLAVGLASASSRPGIARCPLSGSGVGRPLDRGLRAQPLVVVDVAVDVDAAGRHTPERDVRHEEGALIGDHQRHRGLVAPCFRRRPGWAEVVVAEDEHLPGGQGAEPCEPRRVEGSRQGDVAPQMKRARWIDGRLPRAEQRAVPSRRRTRTAAGSSRRCCAPRGASHTRARSPRERSTRGVGRFDTGPGSAPAHSSAVRASASGGGPVAR